MLLGHGDKPEYQFKNQELGLYFKPSPRDPIWKGVDARSADAFQGAFDEIYARTDLDTLTSIAAIPPDSIERMAEIANRVCEPLDINPSFIFLATLQYVEADRIQRQLQRRHWLAAVMQRPDYAPPAETYIDVIKRTFFAA
jgi:hypothetical protein